MRTIKFQVYYQHEDTGIITSKKIELGQFIPELGKRWYVIGKYQFTGLQDKNGKDIYEGHIVLYEIWHGGPEHLMHENELKGKGMWTDWRFPYVVKWNDEKARWDIEQNLKELENYPSNTELGACQIFDKDIYDVEVIGNIHKNPELIK